MIRWAGWGAVALLCLWFETGCGESTPALEQYTVVKGDSLSAIAQRYGTSVDAIQAENQLKGDLIEVGQVLRIPSGASPPEQPVRTKKPRTKTTKVQPCLPPPELDPTTDQGMVASMGLNEAQIRQTMQVVFSDMSACFSDGWPSASVEFSMAVHCSGRVEQAKVVAAEGIDAVSLECVGGHVRRAVFPAHDTHPVFTFQYPMRISPG